MNVNKEIVFVGSLIVGVIFFWLIFGPRPTYILLWLLLAGQIVVNWAVLNKTLKEVISNV